MAEERTKHLVHGYVAVIKVKNQIIGISVIELIIKFYYSKTRIIYISSSNCIAKEAPIIYVAEFDTKKLSL